MRPILLIGLTALCGLLAAGPARADTVDARCDVYAPGAAKPRAVMACQFSQRQGFIGITRSDGVRHDLSPTGGPGRYVDQDGRPAVRSSGLGARGHIYRLADETVRVYWSTAGLPASAASAASAAASPTRLPPVAVPAGPFDRTLQLQGITFRVRSENASSVGEVHITPAGLAVDNAPQVRPIDGLVVGAEVADLDADGSPELYVYVSSAGSGSHGSLVALAANRRRSLSDIVLPPLEAHPGAASGYQGHDQFAVGENRLLRRFPVYKGGDANASPSGGVRQLQYRLVKGEATWQLRVERVVAY
ncbi:MAG: PliI family lysozyme inhibitor of I-type lysozyme [Aquabacterium sp.]